jgi:flagellar FliJ protein
VKYTFRLQTLWKLRVAEREERQLKLAEAQRADDILRTQGEELEAELAAMARGLREGSQPGAINVDRLLDTERYELVLAARREVLRGQRARLAAEIERRRQALVEADRQVKVLEKLREKQLLEHSRREQALEMKRLDEIALRRRKEPAL